MLPRPNPYGLTDAAKRLEERLASGELSGADLAGELGEFMRVVAHVIADAQIIPQDAPAQRAADIAHPAPTVATQEQQAQLQPATSEFPAAPLADDEPEEDFALEEEPGLPTLDPFAMRDTAREEPQAQTYAEAPCPPQRPTRRVIVTGNADWEQPASSPAMFMGNPEADGLDMFACTMFGPNPACDTPDTTDGETADRERLAGWASQSFASQKSPHAAALLSLIIPGSGHFYVGHAPLGIAYFIAATACAYGTAALGSPLALGAFIGLGVSGAIGTFGMAQEHNDREQAFRRTSPVATAHGAHRESTLTARHLP
ncbi:TM2 domain-containing membrane protein YozV [Desulfobaculum xiamenense]|uniref:TM2 domain-containing membrane protein YozV n=1 Tax=Desulfobaculum xiamenense TaxID=995050 RepID=A0A846QQC7_9BACT|nr:hypothetical protein [Desulfobaculum xiamenense]NJB67414.1 TM2 domain-containing membrane protein YozV [Desulfobaculum xiamenense]